MAQDDKGKKLLRALLDGDTSLDAAADILSTIDDAKQLKNALGDNARDLPRRLLSPTGLGLDGDLLWELAEMQLRGVELLANFAKRQVTARLDRVANLESPSNAVDVVGPAGGVAVGQFVIENKSGNTVLLSAPPKLGLRSARVAKDGERIPAKLELEGLADPFEAGARRRVRLRIALGSELRVGDTYVGHLELDARPDDKALRRVLVRVSVQRADER